jgi:PTH1 family peptidyl-tRNA hydrolase
MKLIIGLGNPGPHYQNSRHNTGFMAVNLLAEQHGLTWANKPKFKAEIAEGLLHGQKVILAKPTTYYNLSGEAARAIKDFYKLELSDILVIHDELDLPLGTIRARIGGSDAGNNGVKNLIEHLGEDFARLRVGVTNQPLTADDHINYVLGSFSKEENKALPEIFQTILELTLGFIDETKKFEHTSVRII